MVGEDGMRWDETRRIMNQGWLFGLLECLVLSRTLSLARFPSQSIGGSNYGRHNLILHPHICQNCLYKVADH